MHGAGSAFDSDIESTIFDPPDPMDTLLEAHAVIVAEVRVRAMQPDIDGRELTVLARALTSLEKAIGVIADGPTASGHG